MKLASLVVGALAFACCWPSAAQVSASNDWWSYLAGYEGVPGSARVDMALIERAPVPDLRYVVIAGVKYKTPFTTGLPDQDELQHLNSMSDELIRAVIGDGPALYVGTFTHNGEQVHYIYVKDIRGKQAAFVTALAAACAKCEPTYRTKDDPGWNTYLKFLYPSRETMDFHHFNPRQRQRLPP